MTVLTQLHPSRLWAYFDQICRIPHPSGHEAGLRQWIQMIADSHRLTYETDRKGNLLVHKPATERMEQCQPVILQAHLDMVPQATSSIQPFDFRHHPILPQRDGDVIRATGTTLGADNGIGVAACLAVLTDPTLKHGPLEVLFTVEEEIGMGGAFAVTPEWLKGTILINTDTEQEGEIFIGCAGGAQAKLDFQTETEPCPPTYTTYSLELSGLRGGHSGLNIHEERGNAILILCRLLQELEENYPLRLQTMTGGTVRNAIPSHASAIIALPEEEYPEVLRHLKALHQKIKSRYQLTDPYLELRCIPADPVAAIFTLDTQHRIIDSLLALPDGMITMSPVLDNVVETSSNLGVLQHQGDTFSAIAFIRSLIDQGRADVRGDMEKVAAEAGAQLTYSGDYSGWAPDPHSSIVKLVQQQYQRLFHRTPELKVIHAGLECGRFKQVYPHWDIVSIGPTITGAHSPDECVEIATVQKFWQLLTATLAAIPKIQAVQSHLP